MIELVDAIAAIGIDFTNVAAAGPPSELPGAVPEFVGEILRSVRSFLDGTVENLGKTVRDLTPGGN